MTEETRIRSKGYMTYLVIFMGFIALVDQYLSLIETTAIPYITYHFDIADNTFFFWQGIVGILAFFVFVLSWFADLWGRKKGILILLITMSLTALLIGLIGGYQFWIFLVLYGIMILGTNVNLWTLPISEESIAKKRAFNGSMAFLIGLLPLYAIVGEPIADSLGWPWMFGIMGIFGLALILPWFFMKETKRWETNQEEFKHSAGQYKESLKMLSKKDWIFVVIAGTIYICWSVAFKFATGTVKFYYEGVLSLDPDDFYTQLLISSLATIIGALTIGIIMDKLGRIFAFIFASVGAAISYLGMAFLGLGIFMIFSYFFMACFLGFLLVYITEMFPTKIRGTAYGLTLSLSRLGYVIGPFISAAILPAEATPAGLGAYRTLYVVGAIIALLPLLSLLVNKYEPKGKSLEQIETDTDQ